MQVAPDKGSKAQNAQDLRSLSGGERSFSTLAFILALGHEIAAGFHCLDEFDVFLDVQNRLVRLPAGRGMQLKLVPQPCSKAVSECSDLPVEAGLLALVHAQLLNLPHIASPARRLRPACWAWPIANLRSCVQMSIKILIEAARDWDSTQFILLTPQEVNAISKAEADVREETEASGSSLAQNFVTVQQMQPARIDRRAAE